jgi:adenylylsulfate kinase
MGHVRPNGETGMEARVIVLAAFISPYRADREHAHGLVGHGKLIEIYCNALIEIGEALDTRATIEKLG